MKTSVSHGHNHDWDPGDNKTSYDDGHDHKVGNPASGWTDAAGMGPHKHRLPAKYKVKKK